MSKKNSKNNNIPEIETKSLFKRKLVAAGIVGTGGMN